MNWKSRLTTLGKGIGNKMETNVYYFVYETRNLVNNKIYIGAHSTDNMEDGYMGSGKALEAAIRKYGKENFVRNILFYCSSSQELYDKEAGIVTEEFIKREDTYNLVSGGKGFQHGHKVNDGTKEKISKALTGRVGRKLTEEEKAKLVKAVSGKPSWAKGKHFSEEHRRKLSDAQKGKPRPISEEQRQRLIERARKRIGSHRSDAEKLAISKSKKGKSNGKEGSHMSEETKAKLRKAHTGKKLSEEHKKKLSIAHLRRRP